MDNVNHPAHYNRPGQKECIEEMQEVYGTDAVYHFCLLNAYKYRYRAGRKSGNTADDDLKKAEWYEKYARSLSAD